ncbi:putative HTH-type transcriptional regulator [Pseudovibrio axinellae]|uniref:Putative HTH-type transcriptional regulator n=1 Tax=Pseudovibrio axinellae TaxID=989403 RepID=A0A161XCR5_9HYPH|nr:LysR family transcriptional regulator ArgP [Pseudovibrio axinellae]KZL09441.1 putative HTH-type transcriptional regulator [Pseudovibrio axinellae]SEQ64805.1 LysR family transcriptional regulator, chromosome initiation inhibitor [Pseudovibrio axinellae]
MYFDRSQLMALASILTTGTFEKAAQHLGVTQSAISQRLKALEEKLGCLLVIRGHPCTATAQGERLLRHANEVALLEKQTKEEIGFTSETSDFASLQIAVNADSLATWFIGALAQVDGFLFDLKIDDQEHSANWLRRGEVQAAVSSESAPIQGCDCFPLGALRYQATASPEFMEKWFAKGVTLEALKRAPSLTYNNKDTLQTEWLKLVFGEVFIPNCHWLASSHGFIDATVNHIGWGMNPQVLAQPLIDQGKLVELIPNTAYETQLYWHISRSTAHTIKPLTKAVRTTAKNALTG